jgi:hypothetical protein
MFSPEQLECKTWSKGDKSELTPKETETIQGDQKNERDKNVTLWAALMGPMLCCCHLEFSGARGRRMGMETRAFYMLGKHSTACQLEILNLFFFFLWYWGLNSGPTPWATPPALFLWTVFWDRVSKTICLGWLQTSSLLISASWVAGITGMSHQRRAHILILHWVL